jgi:hypothetical protein
MEAKDTRALTTSSTRHLLTTILIVDKGTSAELELEFGLKPPTPSGDRPGGLGGGGLAGLGLDVIEGGCTYSVVVRGDKGRFEYGALNV